MIVTIQTGTILAQGEFIETRDGITRVRDGAREYAGVLVPSVRASGAK